MLPNSTLRQSLFALVLAATAAAQTRVEVMGIAPSYYGYLQIAGIPGDVTQAPYAGWFRVDDFAIATRSLPGTRAELSSLTVHGAFATATPGLLVNAIVGRPMATVKLDLIKVGTPDTLVEQIMLTNAILVESENDGKRWNSGRLEFTYNTITWTWKRASGDLTTTWDAVRTGTPFYRNDPAAQTIASGRDSYVAYMKVPGVDGGVTRQFYNGWIAASDFSAGVLRALANPLPQASTAIQVNAFLGQALPGLLQVVQLGNPVTAIDLHLFRSATDARPILELRLTNAFITGVVNHAQAAGAGTNVSVKASTIEWTYVNPTNGARTRGCWDFVRNTQC
jgi:type VI protein secretion system component Hcp